MKQQFLDLMRSGERVTLDTDFGAVKVTRAGAGAYAALVEDDELCEFAAAPSVALQALCRRLAKPLNRAALIGHASSRSARGRRESRR